MALREEMRADPRVIVFGEDVAAVQAVGSQSGATSHSEVEHGPDLELY